MVSTAIILFCTCAAFVAGFIDSIAGGGGLITMPALLLSGLPPQLALGTNKVGCCLGTGVAMLNFARSNLILWRLALLGVGFSLVGAGIGTELALYISPDLLGKVLVPTQSTVAGLLQDASVPAQAKEKLQAFAVKTEEEKLSIDKAE